jgi:DNA-binding CsgD family transcriptional regulator
LDEELSSALEAIESQVQRKKKIIQTDLIAKGLAQHYSTRALHKRWDSLSSRERDVAA